MAKESRGNGSYELINPPNLLKAKVGNGAGGGFDPTLLSRAEKAITSLKDDFEALVLAEAAKLTELSDELGADRAKAEKIGAKAFVVGHDIGGQGATFGYDLVTEIGLSLCRYIERIGWPGDLNADVLRAHADALRAVVGNRVNGHGGKAGASLVEGLRVLVDRMTA